MTTIEWTDEVWNPVTGCTKVSAGCKHCYAERIAKRFWGNRKFTDIQCHLTRLAQPLRWRNPRRVFVNSMSDLFHEEIPNPFIQSVFAVMAACPKHIFQVLTKRPALMQTWFTNQHELKLSLSDRGLWPMPNVWIGVSVEDQETADNRIRLLMQIPAALRFMSCEPLLGPIDLMWPATLWPDGPQMCCTGFECGCRGEPIDPPLIWAPYDSRVEWIIVGGESGPSARPCKVEWIYSIVRQCREVKIPIFVKQLGSHVLASEEDEFTSMQDTDLGWRVNLKHPKGADPSEWPVDLRVREMPVKE